MAPGSIASLFTRCSHAPSPSRGAFRVRVILISFALEEKEGAGKVGCWPHPWPPCVKSARGRNHRFGRRNPTFPARWSTSLYALSPGTGVLAPVIGATRERRPTWPQHREARTTRFRRPCRHARRAQPHVHRIPRSTLVTFAKRPSSEAGHGHHRRLLKKRKKNIFHAMSGHG